ncbi:MAG: LOG family protein [Candidatus Moranbacteria bacterium]|nr:LOG family protein [Candidatus Moranbacteria bacterium]
MKNSFENGGFFDKEHTKQGELFFENDPELKEKYNKCKFNVSILGGNASVSSPETEEIARNIGYNLVRNWYSIQTGGYIFGTMKAALEGGNEALSEMKTDPKESKILNLFNPVVRGITAENLKPIDLAVKGENIQNEVAEGSYDLYLRLGKLIEDSNVCIILPGSLGTETEVMANLAFGKFKSAFGVSVKPVIFVGGHFDNLVKRFIQENKGNNNIYKVDNEQDALELVDLLNKKLEIKEDDDTSREIQEAIDSKLYA